VRVAKFEQTASS